MELLILLFFLFLMVFNFFVDFNGDEYVFTHTHLWMSNGNFISIKAGTIKQLFNKNITWLDSYLSIELNMDFTELVNIFKTIEDYLINIKWE